MEKYFIDACRLGNLKDAIKYYKMGINMHFKGDEAFRYACFCGKLEIVKWLYLINNKIMFNDIDYIFKLTCYYGHFEVAQWLYSIDNKINIFIDDNYIFRMSCIKGYINIVIWLISICNDYKAEIKDGIVMSYEIKKMDDNTIFI